MKTITAIIRPTRLSGVKDALLVCGIEMMTVSSVMVCGGFDSPGYKNFVSSSEDTLLNKTRMEIIVSDEKVKSTIDAIVLQGSTGASGDGKIFVMDMPQFIKISHNPGKA
jgi:nitrogen regulatory protein PII